MECEDCLGTGYMCANCGDATSVCICEAKSPEKCLECGGSGEPDDELDEDDDELLLLDDEDDEDDEDDDEGIETRLLVRQ